MDVLAIRKKANDMFYGYYRLLVPAFYMINCVTLLAQLSSSGFLSLTIEFLLVTLSHGFIHMALMLDHGEVKEFSFGDIFIGIKQFAKYFPSYIVRKVILVGAMLLIMVPAFSILYHMAGEQFYRVFDHLIYLLFSNSFRIDMISFFLTDYFSWWVLLFIGLGVIVYFYLSAVFILVPCIVEDYDYAWNEALIKSAKMMSGHIKDFIRLVLSFTPNYLAYFASSLLVMSVCGFLPIAGTSTYLVISMLLMITSYQIRFYQAISIFYLELRDQTREPNSHELFKI